MARHQPLFNFRRAIMNADHVWNLSAPVFATRTWTAFGMAEAQPANHLRAQLTTRHGVDRGVDGFMRNLQRRRFGMHKRQCASNLLRRIARFQLVQDMAPQGSSWPHAALNTWRDSADMGALMGGISTVAACQRRSPRAARHLRS